MDVVARAVALIVMAMPAKMEQVELIDQPVLLQQVERPVDRDARDPRVDFLRSFEDLTRIHVSRSRLHHLQHYAPLAGQPNAASTKLALEPPCRLVNVDALANRYTMSSTGGHDSVSIPKACSGPRGEL